MIRTLLNEVVARDHVVTRKVAHVTKHDAVIQVELKEGPRLTTNLLDCPLDQIKIGDSVVADYEDITDEITLIQFRRTSDAHK